MATLDGTDLGDIQSEEHSKDATLFQTPLPRADSDDAILLDLFGMFRTITIEGVFQGTEAQQRTFIAAIETIENGQQSGSTFVSSLITSPASYAVLVQTFSWTKSKADINKITYRLTLFEGGV